MAKLPREGTDVLPPLLPETSRITIAIRPVLETLGEMRGVEYKGSCAFNDIEHHVVKTAMAMANLRGGGYIIVGVARVENKLRAIGVQSQVIPSYDPDRVLAAITKYATPAVDAVVGIVNWTEKQFVVIAVDEFHQTPIVCGRDGEWPTLKEKIYAGTMFIRPRGFVATRAARSAAEMDEVLDLATEKRAMKLVTQTKRLHSVLDESTSGSKYSEELGDAASL